MKHVFPNFIATVLVTLLAGPVSAASVVYDPFTGEARGISDLSVNGTFYDVSFVSNSYDALYAIDTPEFLNDSAQAFVAATEILSVMLAEPSKPLLFNGINPNQSQVAWVVFETGIDAFGTATFRAQQVGADFLQPWQIFPSFTGERSVDYSTNFPGWMFASFGAPGSLAIPPIPSVPLPAGGLLLIGGLGMLVLNRRLSLKTKGY